MVWGLWLGLTASFHPTVTLALIVTTALVGAYAAAAHLNLGWLVPRLWRRGRRAAYGVALGVAMVVLTGGALAVIRGSYAALVGPDPDPWGALRHFAIDLFGMVVHVALAWRVARRLSRPSGAGGGG